MNGNFDMLESLKKLGLTDLIDKKTSDLGLMAPKDTLQLSSFTHRWVTFSSKDLKIELNKTEKPF